MEGVYSAVAAGAVCTAATVRYGIVGRGSQIFGKSVYRGPGLRRSIALTFDDGPSPGSIAMASYLESEHTRATFFQCGENVQRHPDITMRLQDGGHELANHTFSHVRLCPRLGWKLNLLSPQRIYEEFASTQRAISSLTNKNPTLCRAPYGFRWHGMAAAQKKLGLLGVMWTVIGQDWMWSAERIAERVLRSASPGGIVCLHDGRDIRPDPDISETIKAVKIIVPRLRAAGFTLETVSEVLEP